MVRRPGPRLCTCTPGNPKILPWATAHGSSLRAPELRQLTAATSCGVNAIVSRRGPVFRRNIQRGCLRLGPVRAHCGGEFDPLETSRHDRCQTRLEPPPAPDGDCDLAQCRQLA